MRREPEVKGTSAGRKGREKAFVMQNGKRASPFFRSFGISQAKDWNRRANRVDA